MLDVVLHPGRDRSIRRRHPWVLSGAIARVVPEGAPGALARVLSAEGETLGFGHLSPRSSIRVRILTFGKEPPDDDLLETRIHASVRRRTEDPRLFQTDALRLVNAEGDGLPGLVADRYGEVVVVKLASAGMEQRRRVVVEALRAATGAEVGYERADATAARQEGVAVHDGPLWGDMPEGPVEVRERGRRFLVDPVHGQKTGFYLDQRDARDLVESLANRRRVLDLFGYTGGFSVAAMRGHAESVTLVESSRAALELAQRNLGLNAPESEPRLLEANAFHFVRRDTGRYGLLIVDPPPLARRRRDLARASRAYKDVLLHTLRLAEPDALVLAFACSHHVGADLFRKIVFGASLDAGRPAQVLGILGAPVDHPVSIDHPEGSYLTGLLLRV